MLGALRASRLHQVFALSSASLATCPWNHQSAHGKSERSYGTDIPWRRLIRTTLIQSLVTPHSPVLRPYCLQNHMWFMHALDSDYHFENPWENVITDTEYKISATMKLTLSLLSLSFHLFAHAKDCSKDTRCVSSTLKTTTTTSKTSTTSTESSTPSLTVATGTICYLGSASYTTFEKTTTEQVCTPSSWVTLTSSAVYGSSSCFPTAVTRRIG
jgi:hypothetical protein